MPNQAESFSSITPKNEALKGLIAYYYFHETHDPDGLHQVIYYPHYQNVINVYRNASVNIKPQGREIKANTNNDLECYYTSNLVSSRVVKMYGMHKKIGIVLQPLGINHFFSGDLRRIRSDVVTPFDVFGNAFLQMAEHLYQTPSIQSKRNILDAFFGDRLLGFDDRRFHQMVQQMLIDSPTLSGSMMAQQLCTSEKTVYRKFIRYMGHSPSAFKMVLRFRLALNNYHHQKNKATADLTSIGINSAYYDQSDFIKQYKSLVGLTPKQLFDKVQIIGDNNTIWTPV